MRQTQAQLSWDWAEFDAQRTTSAYNRVHKKDNVFLPQDDPTSNQVFMKSGSKAITSGFDNFSSIINLEKR